MLKAHKKSPETDQERVSGVPHTDGTALRPLAYAVRALSALVRTEHPN